MSWLTVSDIHPKTIDLVPKATDAFFHLEDLNQTQI